MIETLESALAECARAGRLAPCSIEGFERGAECATTDVAVTAILNSDLLDHVERALRDMIEALPEPRANARHDSGCWRRHVRCALERIEGEVVDGARGYPPVRGLVVGP